jgi:Tfp pilus assembly protein PilO
MAANEWPEKTRMIVTIVIGVVVNIGLGALLYTEYSEWKQKDQVLTAKKKEIEGLRKIVDRKPTLDEELKKTSTDFESKKGKLPDAAEFEALLDNFAPIAEHNNCKRKTFRKGTTDSTPGNNLMKSVLNTTWDADFFGWCKMVNEIEERFPRFIAFENLRITPKNSGMVATGSIHDISVDIVTYQYVRNGP